MNKLEDYYLKLVVWVQTNPAKATLIGVFAIGFLIGAILL